MILYLEKSRHMGGHIVEVMFHAHSLSSFSVVCSLS